MESYLQYIVDWVISLPPLSIYCIFFLVAYIENIIPPMPGDVLVAFGGYLAAEQIIDFTLTLSITTISSVFGFMTMYSVGKYFGDKIDVQRKKFWMMRFVDIKYFDKAKRWMHRWGQRVIIANRFLAGTRSVISLTAGITNTNFYSTIFSSLISSILWNGILLWMGWLVHENWQIIGDYLNIYGRTILVLILIAVAARIIYKRRQNRKSEKAEKNKREKVD